MKKILVILMIMVASSAFAQHRHHRHRHHRHHHAPAPVTVVELAPCQGMCYARYDMNVVPLAGGQIENLPEAGPPEIAVFGGIVHVAYTRDFKGGVRYSKFENGAWTSETVDDEVVVNSTLASIALDSNGNPAIAYVGEEPEGLTETFYVSVRQSDGTWSKFQVANGDIREHFRIFYDSTDQIHVVFHSWNFDTGTWTIQHNDSIVYSYPDNPLSTTAMDAVMVNDQIHIVAHQWNYVTMEGKYLYWGPDDIEPKILRSAVSGTGLAYYRTMTLKKDPENGIHLMSCLEIYSVPIPGEENGYAAGIFTEYGYKAFGSDWGPVGFVHNEDIQYGIQAIFVPVSAGAIYQLSTYQSLDPGFDESIVMYRLQDGTWSRIDRVIPGPTIGSEILETADMALVDGIFVVYSQLETGTGEFD